MSSEINKPSSKTSFAEEQELGLYAIVDNLLDLKRLIKQGVNTLQWRVKPEAQSTDTQPTKADDAKENLQYAIKLCQQHDIRLYINDDWQLALEFSAYGIHLGQEDLEQIQAEDLLRIQKQGMRLGISCHNETELAYAHSLKPSYLAFGPVFTPNSKIVDHPPLGLAKVEMWQNCYGKLYPTTCIGGIDLDNMPQVLATGIRSIAVISALNDEVKSAAFIKTFALHLT